MLQTPWLRNPPYVISGGNRTLSPSSQVSITYFHFEARLPIHTVGVSLPWSFRKVPTVNHSQSHRVGVFLAFRTLSASKSKTKQTKTQNDL